MDRRNKSDWGRDDGESSGTNEGTINSVDKFTHVTYKDDLLFALGEGEIRKSTELPASAWKPSLTKREWGLVNRAIKSYSGEDFNDTKRFVLKSEKGETVFAVYSNSDDGTLLYAVGKKIRCNG